MILFRKAVSLIFMSLYVLFLTRCDVLLLIFIGFGYVAKDVSKCVWNDSSGLRRSFSAGHSVSFASAGLAVRKDRSIIALQNLVHYRSGGLVVDVHLSRVCVEYRIEGEDFRWLSLSRIWILYGDLGVQSIHFYYVLAVDVKLLAAQRPNSYHHPDIFYLSLFRRAVLSV